MYINKSKTIKMFAQRDKSRVSRIRIFAVETGFKLV